MMRCVRHRKKIVAVVTIFGVLALSWLCVELYFQLPQRIAYDMRPLTEPRSIRALVFFFDAGSGEEDAFIAMGDESSLGIVHYGVLSLLTVDSAGEESRADIGKFTRNPGDASRGLFRGAVLVSGGVYYLSIHDEVLWLMYYSNETKKSEKIDLFTSVPTGPDDVDIAYDVEIEQVKIRTGNIVSAYGAYPMNKKSVTRLWDSDEFVRVGSTTVRLRDKDLDITKTFFSSGNVVTLHVGYCDDSKQHESLQLLTCDSSTQEACTLTCERLIGGMQNCGICGPEIGQSNAHTFVRRTQRRMDIEVGGGCGGFMPLFCIPALYSRDLYLVELYANKREPVTLLLGEDATNVRHITGSADSRWTVYADNREYVHLNTYILANNPPGTYRPVLLAEHALPLQVESL